MKKILLITMLSYGLVASSAELVDLNTLHDSSYRVGTTDAPEVKINYEVKVNTATAKKEEDSINSIGMTYADLSLKRMANEFTKSIEGDYETMMSDLSVLWQGAAVRSDTVKYALYKLSNPDKDKPTNGAIKNVLQTIAGMSTLVGAGTGNALLSCASLIGGNTLGIMSQDVKALNYKYTKVGDADMIILVRKIDDLQQKIVNVYYDYLTTRKVYEMTTQMVQQRQANYRAIQDYPKEVILVADAFYRNAIDLQMKARGDFYEKRSTMEQLVGHEAFAEFEKMISKRLGVAEESLLPVEQTDFTDIEDVSNIIESEKIDLENVSETELEPSEN